MKKQNTDPDLPIEEEENKSPLNFRLPGGNLGGLVIWLFVLSILSFWAINNFTRDENSTVEIPYSHLREQLQNGNVRRVIVQGEKIIVELKEPQKLQLEEQSIEYKLFSTYLPSFGDSELLSLLEAQDVEILTRAASEFSLTTILVNYLPFVFLLGMGYLLFVRTRNQGQNVFSVGKSGAKLYDQRQVQTTFDDIAGSQGAKAELKEIIEFLKEPERFERLGGAMPKGVLLVGPPGTGKTLLARAVAGEAHVPFFNITGSNFMEMFVGVGASRVRDLFSEAKKAAPAIIFIDELDSIGRLRGAGLGGGHDEREQTLNQLLSEMDGFEPNAEVIVMAATNRPDILDPALMRPGRFDRHITVDLPTMKDRQAILEIHARNKPFAEDVDLERLARGTPGFSGADLENLLNEAALIAARFGKSRVENEDIEEARDKILLGLERENVGLTEEELHLLAYHEAGHTVVAAFLPGSDPIHKVTIVPRGMAMGVTQQLPERDKFVYPSEYLLDRLAVMMGGRAAEELALGTRTSGAENDLKQATKLARKMVLDWGMSERFGQLALGSKSQQVFLGEEISQRREYSEVTAREIDQEIIEILKKSYARAVEILEERRNELDRLADKLLEQEMLSGSAVLELLGITAPQPDSIALQSSQGEEKDKTGGR